MEWTGPITLSFMMQKAKVQVIQSWSQNIFREGWYQSHFFQKRKQNWLSVAESQLTIQATELEPEPDFLRPVW